MHHLPARLGSTRPIARPYQCTGIVLRPGRPTNQLAWTLVDARPPAGPDYESAVLAATEGSWLDVWAVPGASRTEIAGMHDGALRIRVAAVPEGGKANRALENLLSALARTSVELVGGQTSRRKRFLVRDITPAELVRLIAGQTD